MNAINDFGMFLKHERELRGIPLEEIANATKIHMRFLTALESNNFDEFPGEVFIKGYIRSYAKSIGTNVETILSTYDECVGRQRQESLQQAQAEKNDRLSRKAVFRRNILLGMALAGALFAGFYAVDRYNAPPKKTNDNAVAAKSGFPETAALSTAVPPGAFENIKPEQADLMSGGDIQQVLAAPEQAVENGSNAVSTVAPVEENAAPLSASAANPASGGEAAPATSGPGKVESAPMRLRIRAAENSWFNIVVDNSRQLDFILSAGETKSFSGKDSFKVTIGNKKGAELILNNRTLELPNSDDNVVRDFQITQKLLE